MTRKEIQTVIDANPGKPLYLARGNREIQLHEPVSKSALLRASGNIHSVRVSTFGEARPDLAQYLNRPGAAERMGWYDRIVTFDARESK